jgi:hypothetical protein
VLHPRRLRLDPRARYQPFWVGGKEVHPRVRGVCDLVDETMGSIDNHAPRNADPSHELPVSRRLARTLTGVVVGGLSQLEEGGLQLVERKPAVSVAACRHVLHHR